MRNVKDSCRVLLKSIVDDHLYAEFPLYKSERPLDFGLSYLELNCEPIDKYKLRAAMGHYLGFISTTEEETFDLANEIADDLEKLVKQIRDYTNTESDEIFDD